MKTRLKITIIISMVIGSLLVISFSLYNTVNFLETTLPHNKYGQIDYEKIGYTASLNDFKNKLNEKDLQYNPDDLTLIQGISATSYPPITDYCGYVIANDGNDYWYESTFHKDTLSRNKITEENPMPCRPNMDSCMCSLETKLIEKGWGTMTYLDKTIEVQATDHSVKYRIDGNATVTDSIFSKDTASVIITLDAITSGSLTIELPRTLIDSGHSNCDPHYEREEPFAVLIDHEEVLFEEIATTSEKRTLSISFQENTKKIEIISFCLI